MMCEFDSAFVKLSKLTLALPPRCDIDSNPFPFTAFALAFNFGRASKMFRTGSMMRAASRMANSNALSSGKFLPIRPLRGCAQRQRGASVDGWSQVKAGRRSLERIAAAFLRRSSGNDFGKTRCRVYVEHNSYCRFASEYLAQRH